MILAVDEKRLDRALYETVKELIAIDISWDDFDLNSGKPSDNSQIKCCNSRVVSDTLFKYLKAQQ